MKPRYPRATWKGDGKSGGTYTSGPFKVVFHTTETSGLPSYKAGMNAPHLTYNPKTRIWVQHTDLTTAARALRNEAGGVQTNRDSAIQVEIICYSAKNIAERYTTRMWVGDLPSTAYADLNAFAAWINEEFGVPLRYPNKRALSYTEANKPGFRMSATEWDAYAGFCGHQHVPENTHWDPGAFDWTRMFEEEVEEDPMLGLKRGDKGDAVLAWQYVLLKYNPKSLPKWGPDSDFGSETEAATKALQKKWLMPQTGWVDPQTYGTFFGGG
jgi:hypothetical protein